MSPFLRAIRSRLSPLFALLFLGVNPLAVFGQQPSPTPTPPPQRTGKSYSAETSTKKPPPPVPQAQSPVTFTDITGSSGINFKRAPSFTTLKYLLEAMGDRDLSFTYTTNSAGVGQITLLYTGWGTHFIDADNDGWRDLFVAQSHVLDTIEKTNPYLKYKQTPLLMLNSGKGFVNVSATAGPAFGNSLTGRGAAFGDLNNDGQVDVVIATLDGGPVLLRNEGMTKGTQNHWLGLSLVGSKSNRNGIGARITVTDSTGRKQIFDANTSGSYLASNDPRIIVGLGAARSVQKVEVNWPSGIVQIINEPQLDRYLTISEPDVR